MTFTSNYNSQYFGLICNCNSFSLLQSSDDEVVLNFGGGEKRPDKEVFFNHEIGRKRQRSQTTDDDAWDDDWEMPTKRTMMTAPSLIQLLKCPTLM